MAEQKVTETVMATGNLKEDMIRLLNDKDTVGVALVVKNKQNTVVMIHEDLQPYDKIVRLLAVITEVFAAKKTGTTQQ